MTQNPTLKFKFSLLPGDLIYALAGIQHVCLKYNRKADIYLGLDVEWKMSDEIKEDRQSKYTLTSKSMEMLKPLLLEQPYINEVFSLEEGRPDEYKAWGAFFAFPRTQNEILKWYKSNMLDIVDLDKQQVMPINVPHGNIVCWNFFCFPDLSCDISKPWITVPTNLLMSEDTIIINLTSRYRNQTVSYSFLKSLEKRLVFAGTQDEYNAFRFSYGINLPLLEVKDFYQLAIAIKYCSFFIGNQSLCFALAEAMKVPRILEVCRELPNVIPVGENAHAFYFQSNLEYYVAELAKQEGYKGDPFSQTE